MNCPHCGAAAPESALFCSGCGRPLRSVDQLETRTSVSPSLPASGDGAPVHSRSSGAGGVISGGGGDDEGFLPGSIVCGRYRIVGLLGKGGMGRVYRADDLTLGQPVALKFLPRELAQDSSRLERFRAEVRTSRRVTHPAVCRVHDIGEADGQPFISMELVEGGDLASLLRRTGRLSSERGLRLARQLCAGLAAAHDRGVIHRDLKPANVMIDDAGTVRITDFGLAGLAEEFRGSEVRSGTPAYMAPEAAEGREVTALSDIYSLGLVLYEIFTGCPAFDAETEAQLRQTQRAGGAPDPARLVESIDPAIARVIQSCLEIDPALRPQSARAVAAALPGADPLAAALAAGQTPSPELVAECERGPRLSATAGWLLFAVLAAALLGVAARRGADLSLARVEARRSPEVLIDRALETLRELGISGEPGEPGDLAWGLAYDRERIEELGGDADDDHSEWDTPSVSDLAPIYFWLRQAPTSMRPQNIPGRVTLDEPVPSAPGSVVARFDLEGRLRALRVTPENVADGVAGSREGARAPAEGQETRWRSLIDRTPLAGIELQEAEPQEIPPVFADQRRAWIGELHGRAFRLDAAALDGGLVFADLRPVQENAPAPAAGVAGEESGGAAAAMNILLVITMLVVGLILARRNLRIGRADRRGAWLIGAAMMALEFSSFLLAAHHTSNIAEEAVFVFRGLGWALFIGGLCCVFYLALEPMVRKRWPERLVGWTRLRMWKFSDGLVGRELLFGSCIGVFGLVLMQLSREVLKIQGAIQRPILPSLEPFEGARITFCLSIDALRATVLSAVFFLLLLAILRNVTRHIVPAWILFIALFTAQAWLGGASRVDLLITVVMLLLFLAALTRYGLLGLIATLLVTTMARQAPLTLDFGEWYAMPSLLVLALLLGFGLIAVLAARGGWRAGLAGSRRSTPTAGPV